MSKFNYMVYFNAYDDKHSSNNPSKNVFKWERSNSSFCSSPEGYDFELAPGQTVTLFNGVYGLTQDNTTQYSIAPVLTNSNTYQLSWVGGTSPTFRTFRNTGANATTQVTVTVNGPVVTYTSTGGTNFNLISNGVLVGDYVRIGTLVNVNNPGLSDWKIISLTATSFSVVNGAGVAEGPFTLGSGFASQIDIYSAAGVQVGATVQISGGFSPVSQGTYLVTSVSDKFLQFSSLGILPTEGPITTESISVYSAAKTFVYLESDQHVTMAINGATGNELLPMPVQAGCCNTPPALFMRMSIIYSMTVTNVSTNTANLYFASVQA